ncbi:MAG: hypothetical protein ACR2PT_20415 [Endozoicomonas sp.]
MNTTLLTQASRTSGSGTDKAPAIGEHKVGSAVTPQIPSSNNGSYLVQAKPVNAFEISKTSSGAPPKVALFDGTVVADYTKDAHFAKRLETMSVQEATEIKELISQYPDEYPMPCMAITAGEIKKELTKVRRQRDLSDSDKRVLDRLEQELNDLEPNYPYRQSLCLSYRFLHYKSLLDYQSEMLGLDLLSQYDIHNQEDFKLLYDAFNEAGLKRNSFYQSGTDLAALEAIPWSEMTNNSPTFEHALSALYTSSTLNRKDDRQHSGFHSLRSGIPLIPWPHPLDITYFNLTSALPVWLVGFSLDKRTCADNLQMGSSEFFDHDLFHLAVKLARFYKKQSKDDVKILSNWVHQLYRHADKIKAVSFSGIELSLFYGFHEAGFAFEDIRAIFGSHIDECQLELGDLPKKFSLTTQADVRKACQWLQNTPIQEYTEEEFKKKIMESDALCQRNPLKKSVSDDDCFSVEGTKDPSFQNIEEEIRNQWLTLKQHGLQPDRVVRVLDHFQKTAPSLSPEKLPIVLEETFEIPENYSLEAYWLYNFSLSNPQHGNRVQQACKTHHAKLNNITANLTNLSALNIEGLEAFINECLRRHPELTHKVEDITNFVINAWADEDDNCKKKKIIINKESFLFYKLLQEDYSSLWQHQSSVKKEALQYPLQYMGKMDNGHFSLSVLSLQTPQLEDLTQEKEDEGYDMYHSYYT